MRGETVGWFSVLVRSVSSPSIAELMKLSLLSTTTALVEMAVEANVPVKSLSVQNTTLDDVFVHYTGRQLRDELVKAYGFVMPQRPGLQP